MLVAGFADGVSVQYWAAACVEMLPLQTVKSLIAGLEEHRRHFERSLAGQVSSSHIRHGRRRLADPVIGAMDLPAR